MRPFLSILQAFFLALLVGLDVCSSDLITEEQSEPCDLTPDSKGELIDHAYYSLAYSEEDEQAYWVFYYLTPELVHGIQKRKDNFREDPSVSTGSATLVDYKGSGYDRGHLCPAADMTLNEISMSESFYMSNMSPQHPSFNRGIWSRLENQVRIWALENDGMFVVTGGILTNDLDKIGPNKVSIPDNFYKVLYVKNKGMIGFVLPNEGSQKPLTDFIVPVDSVETLTEIDFFPGLNDSIENIVEAQVLLDFWKF